MISDLGRALDTFDAATFTARHGGHKESRNPHSSEYLLYCVCGSDRLRWCHRPGKQAWKCWGCELSGGTIDLIMLLEQVDRATAIGVVVDGYVGGDAPTELRRDLVIRQPSRTDLTRLAVVQPPPGFEAVTPAHRQAVGYLLGARDLRWEDIRRAGIGCARSGWLKGYVIFPCRMDGGLVYWQARATWDPPQHLHPDQRKAWVKATNYRKTLNPSNRAGAAAASDVLFGYDYARVAPHAVIVEGPVDALKVGPHAVALLGKGTGVKVERLLRMAAQRYTVYFDRGSAKDDARAKAAALAAQLSDYAPTYMAVPPAGHDPGSLTPAQNAAVIAQAVPYRARGLASDLRIR